MILESIVPCYAPRHFVICREVLIVETDLNTYMARSAEDLKKSELFRFCCLCRERAVI